MTDTKEMWRVVVNPNAGSGKTISEWLKIKEILKENGIPYTFEMTKCSGHATEIAAESAREGYRKFLAVGGDGTSHEVLGGIMEYVGSASGSSCEDFTLGVVPIGSGNDWIKSHRIPHDIKAVLNLVKEGRTIKQDIIRFTSGADGSVSYMLNIGGCGLDARTCIKINEMKNEGKRSKFLYIYSLLYSLTHYKPAEIEVTADGSRIFTGKFLALAFGNGVYCGGGLRECPYSRFDDGFLDLTIVPKSGLLKIISLVPRIFNGTLPEAGKIVSGKFRSVSVKALDGNSEFVEADGEICSRIPFTAEVYPQRINAISNL